ncbi:MAG: hypothetical protein IKP35_04835 [Alphaproteobacteria bacterium]|nr:hypothetical protein [Alphaproteobacteria bacterium]
MKQILLALFIASFGIAVISGEYQPSSQTIHRAFGWVIFGLVFYIIYILVNIFKNAKESAAKKAKEAKTKPFKIEIVNNEKYINLKKTERIAFLHDLKVKTEDELIKQRKEVEQEKNKLKNIPADVAKYVKSKDTSSLEKKILNLENKIKAIDELIEAETENH